MSMQKCNKKLHIYNTAVYNVCPMCPPENEVKDDNTKNLDDCTKQIKDDSYLLTQKITEFNDIPSKTTIINFNNNLPSNKLPVVGWVVVIEGSNKGEDFRLIQGKNNIRVDSNNRVYIDFDIDTPIKNNTHVAIIYDHKKNTFFIEHSSHKKPVIINGETIIHSQNLSFGDIIDMEQTKLMFIPLCTENFWW